MADKIKKIIIGCDDGHGKGTPGKRTPDGYQENEFNHYTKEYLMDELEYNGFGVVDCSPSRNDNSLDDRCNIAHKEKCDLFVSIHYNAITGKWQASAEGIETYHYINNSGKGIRAAQAIHTELMKGTKMKNRGVKGANFYVLKNTDMMAVLVECGFMDNKEDAILMKSKSYRQECSIEICKGICNIFGKTYKSRISGIKKYDEILKIVSPEYYKIWLEFVKTHQKDVNLEGLIEKLYYWGK